MKTVIAASLIASVLISSSAYAGGENLLERKNKGWFWYEDPIVQEKRKRQERVWRPIESMGTSEITTEMESVLKGILEFPEEENHAMVERYMELKKTVLDRSHLVADKMSNALLEKPELGYAQEYPTSHIGRQAYHQQKSLDQIAKINSVKDKIGLVLFYKSSCVYSQKFAPVLKDFATNFGISVVAVSVDNQPLPDFPDFRPDNGQAEKLGVTKYPSLYGFISGQGSLVPIAHGVVSQSEIITGLTKLIELKSKEERK